MCSVSLKSFLVVFNWQWISKPHLNCDWANDSVVSWDDEDLDNFFDLLWMVEETEKFRAKLCWASFAAVILTIICLFVC